MSQEFEINNKELTDNNYDQGSLEKAPSSETYKFETEVGRVMDIIINSLYSDKDIFLRELISNASDALDKCKILTGLKNIESGNTIPYDIKVQVNVNDSTIIIQDSGIGMSKDELINNLGTIAQSGTKAFFENVLKNNQNNDTSLIGQFGVGFYSSFLIADRVTVISKQDDSDYHSWSSNVSDASSTFNVCRLETCEDLPRGTRIILHVKDSDKEYLDNEKIKSIIKKYLEFITYPIYLYVEKTREVEDETNKIDNVVKVVEDVVTDVKDGINDVKDIKQTVEDLENLNSSVIKDVEKTVEDVEKTVEDVEKTVESNAKKLEECVIKEENVENGDVEENVEDKKKTRTETYYEYDRINTQEPIWIKNANSVTKEEYENFYKSLNQSGGSNEFITYKHFSVEGNVQFKGLLYIPEKAPFDLFKDETEDGKQRIKLYTKKVFINNKNIELMPRYLTFVTGIIDCEEVQLNVSREILQKSDALKLVKKQLLKKVFDMIEDLDEDKYLKFYEQFSKCIKLGIHEDTTNKDRLVKLFRFYTTKSEGKYVSFENYVSKMKENQKDIYYISGQNLKELEKSPYIESLISDGNEVILLCDPIDEYAMNSINEYDKHKLVCVTKESYISNNDVSTLSEDEKKDINSFCDAVKNIVGEKVTKVKMTNKLKSSPCVISVPDWGMSANMERIIKTQVLGNDNNPYNSMMMNQKILELNENNEKIKNLLESFKENKTLEQHANKIKLLFYTALLSSGYELDNKDDYATQVYNLI